MIAFSCAKHTLKQTVRPCAAHQRLPRSSIPTLCRDFATATATKYTIAGSNRAARLDGSFAFTAVIHRRRNNLVYNMMALSRQPSHARFSSSSTAEASAPSSSRATTDATTMHGDLLIHNPQIDENGKELAIVLTDNAVKQLLHIAQRDKNPKQGLRITVDSGGCHGYQYLMDLTDIVNEDDVVFEKNGARVVIDTITLPMISGSRIDFIEELIGSAFKVLANPHAAHSCGCDTSFEIKI